MPLFSYSPESHIFVSAPHWVIILPEDRNHAMTMNKQFVFLSSFITQKGNNLYIIKSDLNLSIWGFIFDTLLKFRLMLKVRHLRNPILYSIVQEFMVVF